MAAASSTQVFQAEPGLTYVQTTARVCAGMRAVDPIFQHTDPLAKELAGPIGIQRGQMLQEAGIAQEGPGKHLYFAARALLLDKEVLAALQALRSHIPPAEKVQVVNLGCGLDTRPWRLALPANVAWIDVDTVEVIELKRRLLQEQGVDLDAASMKCSGNDNGAKQDQGQSQYQGNEPAGGCSKPKLLASTYCLIAHMISSEEGSMVKAFKEASQIDFDAERPTLWIMEGLLYYLDVAACKALFTDMAKLSPTGSRVLATMVTEECMLAIQRAAKEGLCNPSFYFFSNYGDVLGTDGHAGPGSMANQAGWDLDSLSPDVSQCLPEGPSMCYPAYPAALMKAPYVCQLRDIERIALLTRK